MTHPERSASDGAAPTARTDGASASRSIVVLVALLLVAFVLALVLQTDAQRRAAMRETIEGRRQAAAVVAADANTAMVHAWGALAGAAEVARLQGTLASAPGAVAAAALRARPVAGVVVFDESGRITAQAGGADVALAAGGRDLAGRAQTWAGVVEARGVLAPVLTRRVGGYTLVSVLDPARLLPETAPGARLLLASGGVVLAALPADMAAPGADVRALLGKEAGDDLDGFIATPDDGAEPTAVGAASVATGDLRVYSVAATRSPFAETLRAVVRNILLAAAPILAVGALLLLLRQNTRRAKVAEDEVLRVEKRYRTAADGARSSIFEWNTQTGVIAISDQLAALLRAPGGDLTVPQLLLLATQEERGAVEEAFERAKETGALDVTFRVANAHTVSWVEMRGLALPDADTGEAGSIVGTALDVTARRDAELRARAMQRRLREAIESFTGPFALWDARRRLVLWNRSFQHLFKIDPNVLRQGASYDAITLASASQIRRERADPNDTQTREVELASGAWLQIQERPTAEGGLLTIGLDITTIKTQEEALTRSETTLKAAVAKLERSEGRNRELARSFEEQKRRAEDASSAKSAFLANMSHELRTPLNAVIGFSEIMAQGLFGPLGDPRYQQYSKDILASGNLLLDLINDILDMAKIEAGKFNLSPRPLDPLDAIEQAVRLVKRRAEEKGLQIIVDAPDLPEIEADHRAVKQMLLNLLSNAVKFTEKGGIMVEARATGAHLTLRVIDTGRGIAKEHLPRLARPFEQVDNELARDHPGTGLGLALTKSLAEMHGGRMEIDSQQGKGTVVTIRLPRQFGGGEALSAPIAAE
ncbi:MAG: PAS domain-containing sensor histidine kinase [Hyphomonadaceae bacterium]|nr:PAS domain-containing sensor histidine kinase [Hyphomonadaceae bacterium]